jgi:hypothetical protein
MYTYSFEQENKKQKMFTKDIDSAIKVFNKRLSNYKYTSAQVSYDSILKYFVVQSVEKIDIGFIQKILLSQNKGEVKFYELYSLKELSTEIFRAKRTKYLQQQIKLFFELIITYSGTYKQETPELGTVKSGDLNRLQNTAKNLKLILPKDFWLATNLSVNGDTSLKQVYALKENNEVLLANKNTDFAKVGFDERNYPNINITLNKINTELFAKLTEKNNMKFIAIFFNGHVYSAPMVNGTIDSGKVEISGNFTLQEANEFASIFSGGYLPIKLNFVKSEIL